MLAWRLFPGRRHPAAGLLQSFSQPPTPFWCGIALLRKGFWHLLELIFLPANGALNTHLGLQASQPTVAWSFVFSSPASVLKPRNNSLGTICPFLGKYLFSSFCFHVYLGCLASNKDQMSFQGSSVVFSLREDFQGGNPWRKKKKNNNNKTTTKPQLAGKLQEFHRNPVAKRTQPRDFAGEDAGMLVGFQGQLWHHGQGGNGGMEPFKPTLHLSCL